MNLHQHLLTEAKAMIARGDENYICLALEDVGRRDRKDLRVVRQIQAHIEAALENRTLGDWLSRELGPYLARPTLQLCRMAWCDKMIEVDFAEAT